MPSVADLKQEILNSTPGDWEFFDVPETYVLLPDREIMFVQVDDWRQFNEPWAQNFPDPNAKSANFRLCYNGTPYENQLIVFVDGHRVAVPVPEKSVPNPQQADYSINRYEAAVGRAMSMDDFDRKINASDVSIRNEDF